ncbi:MAG: 16S rRNA (guanine(527)-N(7))-methyltransferase RsmG [Firmicutes bacterium]|nr:16S rRNA (guanine(527)-N(7))-methyltransferase RsmG [Bacillota bacterium]
MKLTEEQKLKLEKYMEGILSWNEKVNLTNITDPAEFRIKHNADSLMCVDFPEFQSAKNIIDVGTGGGFPGIPLAVYAPDKHFTLLDSLNKRLRIIDELAGGLDITNITLVHGRAEDVARNREHREKYDLCVSRAVSNLATLSEYCLPFIKVGGYLLAYKGPGADQEVKDAEKALKTLGGSLVDIRETTMEEYGLDHRILVIEKVRNTPKAYPRKAGTPLKEPLGK